MEEKIDIILATYNTHIPYLKEQIDSILNQTYQNIHLIISDDNSPNKEIQEILKQYEKQDKRITIYLQEENKGYIKNFEFLLKKSEANYIMFADHDDIWYPQKVEKSIETLKKENVDLVYCNANQINEKGEIIHESYLTYKNVPCIQGKDNLAISRCIGIGCSQIFTKEVKQKMLPFTDQVMAHDWLAAFIANEGKGIFCIQEPLLGYRLHNTNVFGGRNLAQNLARWKEEHGKTYSSYLKYRKESVIDKAYLDGARMCLQYARIEEDKKWIKQLVQYYENLEKSKYINWHIAKYFKFLKGKNLTKKIIKEVLIFHFPIVGYLAFKIG